jgi:hypothetical protein
MRANLFEFLFGEAVVQETNEQALGEQIVKLFEDADEVEGIEMVANKKPLAAALKSMGISASVDAEAQECDLTCDNEADYREYCRILGTAEAMHKLAEMGWVMARCGDIAMSNEKPCYRIGFIEIQTAETTDGDKPVDAEKIRKDAQKDASAKFKRDDELNPVELEDPSKGSKDAGIGKPKDGADPEGKPKGSTGKVKESSSASQLVDDLLESPTGIINEYGGHYCPSCQKLGDGEFKEGKLCCKKCGGKMAYPKSSSLRSKEGKPAEKPKVAEATMAGAIPSFPDSGALMGPMNKTIPKRKRIQPPRKAHGVGPENS